MTDRYTSVPSDQIKDDSIKQDDLDITNTPTDGQILKVNMPAGDFTAIDPSTGSGDMTKAVYDIDDDGIVDKAENLNDGSSGGGNNVSASEARSHIDSTSNPHSVTKTQVGLGNVDNLQQIPLSYLDIDDTLSADSDTKVPSQQAVKAYIDTLRSDHIALIDKNSINIALNAFRDQANNSLTLENYVDMVVDEYETENGINTTQSTNQSYDSVNDLYSPIGDANLKLLLNFEGSDGATTTTDESPSNHTIVFNGDAQIDTAQFKFGSSSCLFDGIGDYLSINDSTDWDIFATTTESWTLDFWVKFNTTVSVDYAFEQREDDNNRWNITHSDGAGFRASFTTGGTNHLSGMSAGGEITDTNWHHVAFIKVLDEYAIYVDGTQVNYVQNTNTGTFTANLEIGRHGGTGFEFDGHMDSIRLSKSNVFSATPNVGITDTITIPVSAPVSSKQNITLISDSFTAETTPSNARLVSFEEDVDSITLNTDLKAYLSRDVGQTFTTDFATDDKLDITNHGFSNNDRLLLLSSGTLPAGLDSETIYYVINASTNDFEVSLTQGGGAVDITSDGSGTHTAIEVSELTLSDVGDYETGKQILTADIDVSGQPTGTNMRYIIQTFNNKDLKLHGSAIIWK